MVFEDLLVETLDRVCLVKLNRPRVLNALRKKTLLELESVLDGLSKDNRAGALIVTGEGDRAFSAGGDIGELAKMGKVEAKEFATICHRILEKMQSHHMPIIAAVNGVALGAGFDLVMNCDICVASEKASFGEPSLGLGLTTPFGGTQRLPQIVGPTRAKYLFFTGERVSAEVALQIGLVNRIVEHRALVDEARKLALEILATAPIALRFSKRLVNLSSYGQLAKGDKLEIELYAKCFETADKEEGTRAFLEKRKPLFKGK